MDERFDVVCIGAAIVDSIIKGFDPVSGLRADSASLCVGGDAVNQAMAAARLGLKARIVCALGEDEAGELIAAALERGGVDTGCIVRTKQAPTPVTTMFVRDDGSRSSITTDARRLGFHPERDTGYLRSAGALLLASVFRAPFDDPAAVYTLVSAAKAEGLPVFADTKLPNFRVLRLEDLAEALPMIDYITPNEAEAAYYTGKQTPEAMAGEFLRLGVRNVIIKRGEKGCYYRNAEREIYLDACPVRAVDATGAGDNFIAALVSELLRGSGVEQALRFANACGAICTTRIGASSALTGRQQVLDFLEQTAKTSYDGLPFE